MTRRVECAKTAGAVALGLLLGAVPFLQYLPMHGPSAAHADHTPRHGGLLGMVGDVHLELVRRPEGYAVYVTDARRRPIRPRNGTLAFDDRPAVALQPDGYRLVAHETTNCKTVTCTVELDDGKWVSTTFGCTAQRPTAG